MPEAECLECGAKIEGPEELSVGEVLDCPNCGAELEVIGLNPLTLDLFEEEEK